MEQTEKSPSAGAKPRTTEYEADDYDHKIYICTKHELYWTRGNYDQASAHFETVCPTVKVAVATEAPFREA